MAQVFETIWWKSVQPKDTEKKKKKKRQQKSKEQELKH